MKRSIVTIFGGGGFLGRYVVRLLVREGYLIRIAQRYPDRALFLKPAGELGQIDLVRANLRDATTVRQALEGARFAINLVGILAHGGKQQFEAIQTRGATDIARLCAEIKIERLVQVSAIGADIDSPSAYAKSKAAGEKGVRTYFPNATILRPSLIVGPEDAFFNRFAKMARMSPFLPLIGGQTLFQPVWVEDVATAILRCLTLPDVTGKTFELGGPDRYSFRQLLELMLKETKQKARLLPIPFSVAYPMAALMQWLPGAPLTIDQLHLLRKDNVPSGQYPGFAELGHTPTPLHHGVLSYLSAYRHGGRHKQN